LTHREPFRHERLYGREIDEAREMADLSWADALKFGSASGLIAGAVNQGIGYLRDRAGFRSTAKAQAEERRHQALLREEAAHADARSTFLPLMEEVRERISYDWAKDFGLEVDYHGTNLAPPRLGGPAETIRNLDRVATGHPTGRVRAAARLLHDEVDGVYNMVEGNVGAQPGVEDYSNWLMQANKIIENLHTA